MSRKVTPETIESLRLKEAKLMEQIMAEHAPIWEWLTGILTDQLHGLVKLAGRIDVNLPEGTRAVINGRAALIQEILDKPAKLLTILEDAEQAAAVPPVPYVRPRPPVGNLSKV